MSFQIHPLPAADFAPLFELSDDELAAMGAERRVVAARPGTPCRVSMVDAEIGDTVIMMNYAHQPANTPYKSAHAIFVRQNAEEARIAPDEVPEVIATRLISLRLFDKDHMMLDADVVAGDVLSGVLSKAFENEDVAYAHLHNAKPGCFAATVTRAD